MTSNISSQKLLTYIKEIIQNNEFNYDYMNYIVNYL